MLDDYSTTDVDKTSIIIASLFSPPFPTSPYPTLLLSPFLSPSPFSLLPSSLPQIEMNRKREAELSQVHKDIEVQAEDHDKTVSDMRKKHAVAVGELEEQVATLQKAKAKLEKDRQELTSESGDLSSQVDDLQKAKVRDTWLLWHSGTHGSHLV